MNPTEERPHHDYSPSTLQNLEACPCYQGKESKHIRTIAGVLAHKIVETAEDEPSLSDDDAEKTAEFLDFYERRKQLMEEARQRASTSVQTIDGIQHVAIRQDLPAILELKETYLPIDDLDTTAGYIDRGLISCDRKRAELFDLKMGVWAVEKADNNLQGMAYSLGIFKAYPTVEEVEFFFYQPHLNYVTSATFKRSDIPAIYLRIQVIVAKAKEAREKGDFTTARPMVPVCSFCRHIASCPKVTDFACRVASKFYPLEFPDEITPTMAHDPKNTSLGMRLAQVVKIWAEAFRTQITDRVLRRQAEMPEGYKLESRNGDREVTNIEVFRGIALKYLTEKEYQDALKISFGAIESAIGDKSPRGQKKANIDAFKKELEEMGAVKKGDGYSFLKAVSKGHE